MRQGGIRQPTLLTLTGWPVNICAQDNFCVIEVMGASLEERKKIARASGFHEFLAASGATNASEAPVPANDGSDPEAVRKCELQGLVGGALEGKGQSADGAGGRNQGHVGWWSVVVV